MEYIILPFIDRKKEISILKELKNKNFFFAVIKGRRRIGKTRLVKHIFKDAFYIFIWPNKSINWIIGKLNEELGIPGFRDFSDMLEFLLDKNRVVIIDEFQNFYNVDKSIFGEIQKILDERKLKKRPTKLIVTGSGYSLMNKIFNDVASPLYGRRTYEIGLSYLPLKDLFMALNTQMEDFFRLWSVFDGAPYYYEFVDFNKKAEDTIKDLFLTKDAGLKEEGNAVLYVDFGRGAKTYNTILMAIAEGKTKIEEIASLFSGKVNEVVKYLSILRKDFRLVRRITPLLEDPKKSKKGIYEINDNFLSFWFYFIEKNQYYIEQQRFDEVESFFDNNFNAYLGKKFEKFVLNSIKQQDIIPFSFTKIGRQWGKIPGEPRGYNQYEIDIVALNEETKEIMFCECKWKGKVNAEKIVKGLAKKSQYVDWNNTQREEYYAVFAKSFSKRIKEFKGKRVYCFDLKDIEKTLL